MGPAWAPSSGLAMLEGNEECNKKSNLTEEILSITAGSDRGSYAKPLFVRALSSHSRVRESELSS